MSQPIHAQILNCVRLVPMCLEELAWDLRQHPGHVKRALNSLLASGEVVLFEWHTQCTEGPFYAVAGYVEDTAPAEQQELLRDYEALYAGLAWMVEAGE